MLVKINTSEVADDLIDRADDVAVKVALYELRREGIVNVAVLLVNCNSLAVTASVSEVSRKNVILY